MKRKLLFILFILINSQLFSTACFSQSPNWLWAKGATGLGLQEGIALNVDVAGNALITGYFSGQMTFNSTVLNSAGIYDFFVAKYNAQGNFQWAKSVGGAGTDKSTGITSDINGNAYVTGTFDSDTLIFDNDTVYNAGGNNCGTNCPNIFIAKYDASGNTVWAKREGNTDFAYSDGITSDVSGNILITGGFDTSITFGSITLTGFADIFVTKYNSSGNVLWAKCAGGAGIEYGQSISTDLNNNVVITGIFGSPSFMYGSTLLTNFNNSNYDLFTAKYDSLGNILWAKSAGGNNWDESNAICTDAGGNVLVTGYFASHIIHFDTASLINVGTTGTFDFFLVKYDSSGNVLWVKRAGGIGNDGGRGITTDASQNIYVSGGFTASSISFGLDTIVAPTPYNDPMFVVKLDSGGNIICSDALSTGGDDENDIGLDSFGNAYVTSDFAINPFILGSDTLILTGSENIFTAKFTCIETGIFEIPISDLGFTIYPNPTNTILNLFVNEKENIIITNLLGEIVLQKTVEHNVELDISFLSSGIYFIKAGNEVRKFVKE